MSLTLPPKVGLDVEDFRRLGVRPHECRLAVIRSAAARSAKALAEQQLTSPTDQVGLQLSRVATSAYRLLDPRQRNDVHQRAYVGRILPSALSSASQTSFYSESRKATPENIFVADAFHSDSASDAKLIEMLELESGQSTRSVKWSASLSDEDVLDTTSPTRRITRSPMRLRHPWVMLVLAGLAIGTLLGLATLRLRYTEVAHSSVPPQPLTKTAPIPSYILPAPDLTDSPPPELASSLEMAGGLDVPDELEAGWPELDAANGDVAPLESVTRDPDPVCEQPLEELRSVSSVDGVFLPDSFTTWEMEDSPPAKQDVQLPTIPVPTIPVPTTPVPTTPVPAEPTGIGAAMPALDPSSHGGRLEPAVPRRSVPEPTTVRAARSRLVSLAPELAESVVPQTIATRIGKIEALEKELTIGTVDSWTARLMVAELAWLIEDTPQVSQRLKSLTETYQVQLHQLLAESFVAACDLANFPDTREHLLSSGLALADQLLLAESFQDCQRVVDAASKSAEFLESHSGGTYLKQLSQAADQMSRSSATVKRTNKDAGAIDNAGEIEIPGELKGNEGNTGIAGRYYCLMLRKWDKGLPWLVDASDSRIARVAQQELELDDAASTDDLITLSKRWMTVASRSSGRASDSIRLHAIDLMRKAQAETSGLKNLEIERTIDEIWEVLPPYLRETTSMVENATSPMETAEVKPAVSSQPKNGLSGRIKIAGQDIGVQLNYELGVALTQSVLDTIASRTNRDLSGMSIQLVGEFDLVDPTTIGVTIAAAEQGMVQSVKIDDMSLELDPLDEFTEVALETGTHHVAWTIKADRFSRAVLRLHNVASGRRLTVVQPAGTAVADQGTTLTVALVRGEE